MQPVISWLTRGAEFPPAESADARGLVCAGGDLSVERLLEAYRHGLFPWSVRPITWWSPDPRGIFELDQVHIGRSLARTLRKGRFRVTFDRAFGAVIRACATVPRQSDETWIRAEFVEAYDALHRAGCAHSCECWDADRLVGGVYGVALGGLFAGESMFHHVDDASKVALVSLLAHVRERGFSLFDTQMLTPTTRALGAVEISRKEYLGRLRVAMRQSCSFLDREKNSECPRPAPES